MQGSHRVVVIIPNLLDYKFLYGNIHMQWILEQSFVYNCVYKTLLFSVNGVEITEVDAGE